MGAWPGHLDTCSRAAPGTDRASRSSTRGCARAQIGARLRAAPYPPPSTSPGSRCCCSSWGTRPGPRWQLCASLSTLPSAGGSRAEGGSGAAVARAHGGLQGHKPGAPQAQHRVDRHGQLGEEPCLLHRHGAERSRAERHGEQDARAPGQAVARSAPPDRATGGRGHAHTDDWFLQQEGVGCPGLRAGQGSVPAPGGNIKYLCTAALSRAERGWARAQSPIFTLEVWGETESGDRLERPRWSPYSLVSPPLGHDSSRAPALTAPRAQPRAAPVPQHSSHRAPARYPRCPRDIHALGCSLPLLQSRH